MPERVAPPATAAAEPRRQPQAAHETAVRPVRRRAAPRDHRPQQVQPQQVRPPTSRRPRLPKRGLKAGPKRSLRRGEVDHRKPAAPLAARRVVSVAAPPPGAPASQPEAATTTAARLQLNNRRHRSLSSITSPPLTRARRARKKSVSPRPLRAAPPRRWAQPQQRRRTPDANGPISCVCGCPVSCWERWELAWPCSCS